MGKPRGAGDVVHAVTKATGIERVVKAIAKDCGCKENKAWLNEKINFVNTIGGCMNEEQISHYEYLNEKYFNTKKNQILIKDQDDLKLIMNLYNSVHGTNIKRKECQTCNMAVYWIRLKRVYDNLKKK